MGVYRVQARTIDKAIFDFFPRIYENFELEDCFLNNCVINGDQRFGHRTIIRNGRIINCRQHGCSIRKAIVEDVSINSVENVGRNSLWFTWASVFKHVTLRGKIDSFKINQTLEAGASEREQRHWDDINRAYYSDVDWALDIREAQFNVGIALHAVPGRLIRRNPETQILVTRENAVRALQEELLRDQPTVLLALRWFVEDGLYDEVVLAGSQGADYFEQEMLAFRILHDNGLVDPD
jgi:hypothetical protein